MFGRATIRLGIGPHSSFALFYQIHVYDVVVKKFTFAISFPDEFLVRVLTHVTLHMHHCRFTHSLFITIPHSFHSRLKAHLSHKSFPS